MNGVLLVDKPAGMTSHDVVDRLRRSAKMRRVGHTGTLDPSATGLLVLCLGAATRLSEHFTALGKTYEGTMRLGLTTASYDLEGETVSESPPPALEAGDIQAHCDTFVGDIEQIPPMVSAVRVGGERLYKKARKGEVVDRPARRVHVDAFDVIGYQAPDARVRVCCSSGTYVRSLCHDVGQRLGCGAVLASLRRTAVGHHRVEDAVSLDDIPDPASVEARLLPMGRALALPVGVLAPGAHKTLANGGLITSGDLIEGCPVVHGWIQIQSADGELLALAQVVTTPLESLIQPKRVFCSAPSP